MKSIIYIFLCSIFLVSCTSDNDVRNNSSHVNENISGNMSDSWQASMNVDSQSKSQEVESVMDEAVLAPDSTRVIHITPSGDDVVVSDETEL